MESREKSGFRARLGGASRGVAGNGGGRFTWTCPMGEELLLGRRKNVPGVSCRNVEATMVTASQRSEALTRGLQGQEQRHSVALSVEKKGSQAMGVLATLMSLSGSMAWGRPLGCGLSIQPSRSTLWQVSELLLSSRPNNIPSFSWTPFVTH